MNSPTFGEARPVWRPSGDVATYEPPGMSAAERLARARQAGAPPPAQPVTLQTARRRRDNGSATPARRGADLTHPQAQPPRPAPPPPAGESVESLGRSHRDSTETRKNPDKSGKATKPRAPRTGASAAIRDLLTTSRRPMMPGEIIAALPPRWKPATIYWLLPQMRERGSLVQDARRGPYRTPDMPAPDATPAAPSVRPRTHGPRPDVAARQGEIARVLAEQQAPIAASALLDLLLPPGAGAGTRLPARATLYNDLRQMELRGDVRRHRERPSDRWSVPGMSVSVPSDEAPKTDTPLVSPHANLARLVAELRSQRDALAAEVTDLRARLARATATRARA